MKQHERTAAEKAAYQRQWRLNNKEKRKAQRDREYAKNSEKIKARSAEYRKNNPDTVKAAKQKWQEQNKEYIRQKRRELYAKNPTYFNALSSARHKRLKQVCWDVELTQLVSQEAYRLCKLREAATGFSWHIDHIIPMNGKLVSGLHVWNNLDVIPAKINLKKNNHFSVDDIV